MRDWLAAHLEEWTVTTQGELVEGVPRHYIRINPADPAAPDPHADPDTAMIQIANSGGVHPARNVVGGDFLQLVRLRHSQQQATPLCAIRSRSLTA